MTVPATHATRGRAQRYDNGNVVTERRNGSSVTAWLTADEFRQLDAIAKARDLSKTAVVRRLILEHLAAQGRQS